MGERPAVMADVCAKGFDELLRYRAVWPGSRKDVFVPAVEVRTGHMLRSRGVGKKARSDWPQR